MIVKLLIEHHLECLSLKKGCKGSSESTHVKMPHYWKSHALAHIIFLKLFPVIEDGFIPNQYLHSTIFYPRLSSICLLFTRDVTYMVINCQLY